MVKDAFPWLSSKRSKNLGLWNSGFSLSGTFYFVKVLHSKEVPRFLGALHKAKWLLQPGHLFKDDAFHAKGVYQI
jgi:hypothetical protein